MVERINHFIYSARGGVKYANQCSNFPFAKIMISNCQLVVKCSSNVEFSFKKNNVKIDVYSLISSRSLKINFRFSNVYSPDLFWYSTNISKLLKALVKYDWIKLPEAQKQKCLGKDKLTIEDIVSDEELLKLRYKKISDVFLYLSFLSIILVPIGLYIVGGILKTFNSSVDPLWGSIYSYALLSIISIGLCINNFILVKKQKISWIIVANALAISIIMPIGAFFACTTIPTFLKIRKTTKI